MVVAFDEIVNLNLGYAAKNRRLRSSARVDANCGMRIFAVRDVSDGSPNGVKLCILVAKENIARAKFVDGCHFHFVIIIVANVLWMVRHDA